MAKLPSEDTTDEFSNINYIQFSMNYNTEANLKSTEFVTLDAIMTIESKTFFSGSNKIT